MRTFLKIIVTFVVLAGAFVGYVVFQPAAATRQAATRPAPQVMTRNAGGMIISEGENAWVRQFDDEGRLASRFRAAKWEPQKNGLVRVIRPEAELLLKGGKDKDGKEKPRPLVRIRGDDGEVVVNSLPDAAAADKPLASSQSGGPATGGKGQSVGPAQPPSSGRLNGVVIEVYEGENDPAPRVTLKTNNIVFDNDTFRISTESYRAADGSTVAPDQVEVAVTGPDFEFYGRGLTVRWNDLEERLDLLRIAHGDHLVIKNVEAFSAGGLPLSVPTPKTTETPTAAGALSPMWGMLASADPRAALALAATDRRPRGATPLVSGPSTKAARKKPKNPDGRKDHDQPPYRAAFNDNVRVVQGDQQRATARLMNIDFLPGQRRQNTPATRPAATRNADSGAAPAAAQADPATQPAAATQAVATTQPESAVAASQPATAPAAQPVTVYWTGELTVTPSPLPAATAAPDTSPAGPPPAPVAAVAPGATAPGDEPLPPGEARIELVGAPAVLTHDPLDVKTARFVYRTDGRVALDSAPDFPRVLITQRPADGDGPGTAVSTEGLTYSRGENVAVLRGDSRVLAPIATGETDDAVAAAPSMLDASWRETATFRLVGEQQDELWVEHAAFAGKVNVKAPQGLVRSERLELSFDPPVAGPASAQPPAASATQPSTQPANGPGTPALAKSGNGSSTPNLRRVVASEAVYCELVDAAEGTRRVECQQLSVDTARSNAGELYPRTVDASGAVHASTAEQDLAAGHVVLQLRPANRNPSTGRANANANSDSAPAAPEPPQFSNRPQWALADAGAAGLAGASRAKKDSSPAFELESMTATDAVRVSSKDGGAATGKRLVVTVGDGGTPHVELTGDPARVEHANAGGTLTGPRIELDPKTGVAHVVGAGTLRAVQRDEPKGPAPVLADAAAAGLPATLGPSRPIEVTWADGAAVRGAEDRVDITGAVTLWITDTDGSVRTATAGRLRVELAKKSADATADVAANAPGKGATPSGAPSRPSLPRADDAARRGERPSDPKPAAPSLAQSMDMDLFKDKEVSKVHLFDNAVINSKLTADDGSMLRQYHLKSQAIAYDPRTRHLTIPGPGQLLVEAHDAPGEAEPKQAGSDAAGNAAADAAGFAGGNGVTAFQWAQSLEYDQSAGRAVMDGSVLVSHQPDRKGDPAVRVDADTLTATFEPQPRDATRAEPDGRAGSKTGASDGDDPAAKLQLKSMAARGNILISREGSELSAHEIGFDPATGWVTARGTPRNPATYTAPGAAGAVRAGELQLNTETWQVKVKDVNTRVGGIGR